MNTEKSYVEKIVKNIDDIRSLWKKRPKTCLLVCIIFIIPIFFSLIQYFYSIQNLKNENEKLIDQSDKAFQEREHAQIQLAPFLALAKVNFPDQPENQSLKLLRNQIDRMDEKIDNLENKISDGFKQLIKESSAQSVNWSSIDISQYVPPIATNVLLLFNSQNGYAEGYVRGEGIAEEYPFDTTVNNVHPIPVKIKNQKIQYRITNISSPTVSYKIFVIGFKDNI